MTKTVVLLAGLAGLFFALSQKTLAIPGAALSSGRIKWLVGEVLDAYFPQVDPLMIRAMIEIESGGNPLALRYEPALTDASIGLMQTLYSTAQWLYDGMGYRAFEPSLAALLDERVSIYFGAGYVDYLSRYRGQTRSEQWIVESYNGGPGNSNAGTQNHWRKYQAAKAAIIDAEGS